MISFTHVIWPTRALDMFLKRIDYVVTALGPNNPILYEAQKSDLTLIEINKRQNHGRMSDRYGLLDLLRSCRCARKT